MKQKNLKKLSRRTGNKQNKLKSLRPVGKGNALSPPRKYIFNKKQHNIYQVALLFFIVSIIVASLFFFGSGITGQVILSEYKNYTQQLNLQLENSFEYVWVLENPGTLKSVRLNGLLDKDTSAKVYLENNNQKYLIFDSTALIEEPSKRTGFVVKDKNNDSKDNK